MSNSWGHNITILKKCSPWEDQCTAGRRCRLGPSRYRISYEYVTGRRGRVSTAERYACVEHAERFALKHGLELPQGPMRDRTQEV